MAQLRQNRYPSYYDSSIDDDALDNELASPTSDGLMSKEDKIKLDKISDSGNLQVEVKAADVIEDKDNMFVTEKQIEKWDSMTKAVNIEYDEEHKALVFEL